MSTSDWIEDFTITELLNKSELDILLWTTPFLVAKKEISLSEFAQLWPWETTIFHSQKLYFWQGDIEKFSTVKYVKTEQIINRGLQFSTFPCLLPGTIIST